MRLCTFVVAAFTLIMPAIAVAQTQSYLGRNYTPPDTVIQPSPTPGWRNYVTVPDGPCGCPMAVEADCYNVCRPCGPLHPICFLHRVGRMLDCLMPCNMCCRGGGCGLFHGCGLGGRTWGHCSVCCGGGMLGGRCGGGGCGGGGCGGGGCSTNPCGSAFAGCCTTAPTTGGNCFGCSSTVPSMSDPFIDDALPPKPTAAPAEVRRVPANRVPSAAAPVKSSPVAKQSSPYKIVNGSASASRNTNRQSPSTAETTGTRNTKSANPSVLRRASAEQELSEPAQFRADTYVRPIVRSQTPDETFDYAVPRNPLRK